MTVEYLTAAAAIIGSIAVIIYAKICKNELQGLLPKTGKTEQKRPFPDFNSDELFEQHLRGKVQRKEERKASYGRIEGANILRKVV